MRKTYPLHIEGRHPDRVLDALKHDLRRYLRRERRRALPEGADYWDFDCRFGTSQDTAQPEHPGSLMALIDAVARDGGTQCYVELLARSATRQRWAGESGGAAASVAASEAFLSEAPDSSAT